jgi:aldehyde dehydrogenase (NAD+)
MLVPRDRAEEAYRLAAEAAARVVVGDPADPATTMGPLISEAQWTKVQGLIRAGMAEGARLIAGGPGRPDGISAGWFAQATIFADVTNTMTVAREEIFGPVLVILPYDTVEDAIAIANDTPYGLAAYVQGPADAARAVGRRLRAGQVNLNGPEWDTFAPFGGYKQSGNGREYADWGIRDFCEVKALVGFGA